MHVACKAELLPVTALEYCFIGVSLEVLVAGEGPYLKVFSKDGGLLLREECLPFRKVHGIRPAPRQVCDISCGALLLLFGQKALTVVELEHKEGDTRVVRKSEVFELSDWILDVTWLKYLGPHHFEVAVATAHSSVVLFNSSSSREVAFRSEVNCILYSARLIGHRADTLTVASGTVFNQILLWHLERERSNSRVKVRLCLTGHEGVIFSIRFSVDQSRLVSVSDDRTIRLWSLPPDWRTMDSTEQREACSLVLYGHTARVWDARLLPDCIVSIGEDTTCRVWDYHGRCLETVKGHRGRSIWSLGVDMSNSTVATGGGDCSIRTFALNLTGKTTELDMEIGIPQPCGASKADIPRSVLLNGSSVYCLTNNGFVYGMNVHRAAADSGVHQPWRELHHDVEFSGYSVTAFQHHQQLMALGSLNGCIKVLSVASTGDCAVAVEWKAHEGKVFSLTWASSTSVSVHNPERPSASPYAILFTCGPDGRLICWGLEQKCKLTLDVCVLSRFSLPHSKHRWISSAIILSPQQMKRQHKVNGSSSMEESAVATCVDDVVIVGDRRGSLHTYKTKLLPVPHRASLPGASLEFSSPHCSIFGIHGANGVTCITYHHGSVFTAGRDGYCRQFSLNQENFTELAKFKVVKGMDWIEQLMFTEEDLIVLGFHTTDMVLYSRNQNKHIMRIGCGGGHRSYGFSILKEVLESKRVIAVYIKPSLICVRSTNLDAYFKKPIKQEGFAGREAISLEVIDSDYESGTGLIAIGSEDCNIYLLLAQPTSESCSGSIKVARTIQGHISSVRALTSCESSCHLGSKLLFSGGARASLKVWLIPAITDVVTQKQLNTEVSLEAELYVREVLTKPRRRKKGFKDPVAEEQVPECRIMALCAFPLSAACGVYKGTAALCYVTIGCSDGVIRQYIYDEQRRNFLQLQQLSFHNHCLLSLKCVIHRPDPGLGSPVLPRVGEAVGNTAEAVSSENSRAGAEALILLCSTATDGRVVLWHLNPFISGWMQSRTLPVTTDVQLRTTQCTETTVGVTDSSTSPVRSEGFPLCVLKLHQSGVNDIAVTTVGSETDGSYCIATVGDDNALVVTYFRVDSETVAKPTISIEKQCFELSAHSSSITGVEFLSRDTIVTTSIDQRLTVWRIVQDTNITTRSMDTCRCFHHDIADVASLGLYHTRAGAVMAFCGVGLQIFCVADLLNSS